MTPLLDPASELSAAQRTIQHLERENVELTNLLTLTQIRQWHEGHAGYIWACHHCKDAYFAAAAREQPELLRP